MWFAVMMTVIGSMVCGCIHEMPQVHYYSISLPMQPDPVIQERMGARIAVLDFTAVAALDIKDLAYSPAPYQFGYYDYHQWVAPPAQLLRERFLNDPILTASVGRLSECVDDSDATIRCHVKAFHEIDRPDGCRAVVAVDIVLGAANPPSFEWRKAYYYEESISNRTPAAVVIALNTAVDHLMTDVVRDIGPIIEPSR